MPEKIPSLESNINREEVLNIYRKFAEKGMTNPDTLDMNDPEVKEANEMLDRWFAQEDAGGNEELNLRKNLSKTMFYVDAGFNDPTYLEDVLGWLSQDAQNAEKQPENPERTETRMQIAEAIKKIRHILGK